MKQSFYVIVAGSRSFKDYQLLKQKLDLLLAEKLKSHKLFIVSGNALGADKLGEKYASENDIPIKHFPANWTLHGNKAGYIRNCEMAVIASAAVIFWDGKSKGSKHMITISHDYKLPTRIICYK